jgi:hypothetical protein
LRRSIRHELSLMMMRITNRRRSIGARQVENGFPARAHNMDMSRSMVVWPAHDAQAADAQDRSHRLV